MKKSPFAPSSRHRLTPALRAALALLLGLPIAAASAATFTWVSGTTGNWSVGGNWGGSAPGGTNVTDVLVFGGAVGTTVGTAPNYTATNNIAATPFRFNQLTLQTTDAGASGVDNFVNGSALQLTGTAPQVLQNGAGFTLDAPLDLAAATIFGGTTTGAVTLNFALSGTADITKNGPGTFRFGTPYTALTNPTSGPSSNTWFGRLTINAGVVRFNNNAQSGPTALRANPVTLSAATTLLFEPKASDQASSLRLGTLSGPGGTVDAQSQSSSGNQDSEDITIHAFTDGDFAGLLLNTHLGSGSTKGTVTVRGTAVQTLSGTLNVEKDVAVGGGATLRLAGNASLNGQGSGAIVLNGGTFTLDNATTNSTVRLRDGSATSTGMETIGGGTFSFIGNAAGTTETLSRLQLGTGANPRSGALTVTVTHNAGVSNPTALSFQSYARDQGQNPCNTVNFAARNGAGTPLALGLAAANGPHINFITVPTLFNGLLGNTTTTVAADATTVGWATVNGTDFATHGANGIAPVAITATPAAGSGGSTIANIQLIASFAPTAAYSVNSVNLAPASAGQTLSLPAAGNFTAAAYLLAGSTDFAITSAGAGLANVGGTTGPRYFHVPQAVLTVGASLAVSATSPVVKAGDGTLILTHAANVGVTAPLVINAGSVRATPGSSLPAGELRLRGGVLEITGGGTFTRTVGFGSGKMTWSGIDGQPVGANIAEERGNGGFAAVGADVTVDLNAGGATNFAWEDLGFVDSGFALIFGSRNATARVTFVDNLNLTQTPPVVVPPALAPALNYNAREIRVVDNPASAADYALISGVISGSLQNDLLKTGDGLLELSAVNTMQGSVLITGGTLRLMGTLSASILADVQSGATLAGTGTAKLVLLESGGHLAPGSGGIGTLNATGLTWRAGGVANFDLGAANASDRIALGSGALAKGTASGTFAFDFGGTGAGGQTYTLATFGSTTFAAADFSATNLAAGVTGTFAITGGNTLTFTTNGALAPLEAWRQQWFGAGATNTGNAADIADPEGDGLANLGEYALSSGTPLTSSTAIFPVTGLSGVNPTFTFTRNLSATDITLLIQSNADPALAVGAWTTIASHAGGGSWVAVPLGSVTVVENGSGVVTMTDTGTSVLVGPKRFYRLKVTHP